jgi:polyhydroxyalkanoate synthesis regulator phasin
MQDAWRAYLELALGLTEASKKQAEKAAKKLVGKGGATASQLQALAEDVLSTSAANREALTKIVRLEVDRALGRVGLASADEVSELTGRVRELERELRDARARAAAAEALAAGGAAVAAGAATEATAASDTLGTDAAVKKAAARKVVAKKAVAPLFEAAAADVAPPQPSEAMTPGEEAAAAARAGAAKKAPAKRAVTVKRAAPAKKAAKKAAPAKKAPPAAGSGGA